MCHADFCFNTDETQQHDTPEKPSKTGRSHVPPDRLRQWDTHTYIVIDRIHLMHAVIAISSVISLLSILEQPLRHARSYGSEFSRHPEMALPDSWSAVSETHQIGGRK